MCNTAPGAAEEDFNFYRRRRGRHRRGPFRSFMGAPLREPYAFSFYVGVRPLAEPRGLYITGGRLLVVRAAAGPADGPNSRDINPEIITEINHKSSARDESEVALLDPHVPTCLRRLSRLQSV